MLDWTRLLDRLTTIRGTEMLRLTVQYWNKRKTGLTCALIIGRNVFHLFNLGVQDFGQVN